MLATTFKGCHFRLVADDADWRAYDGIRQRVLFEDLLGRTNYVERHPDEFAPGNVPILLIAGNDPIGTVRIDIRPPEFAILRLIAIRPDFQGHGYGTTLISLADRFAQARRVDRLALNADPSAVDFYRKAGFVEEVWNASENTGTVVQMTRPVA